MCGKGLTLDLSLPGPTLPVSRGQMVMYLLVNRDRQAPLLTARLDNSGTLVRLSDSR